MFMIDNYGIQLSIKASRNDEVSIACKQVAQSKDQWIEEL